MVYNSEKSLFITGCQSKDTKDNNNNNNNNNKNSTLSLSLFTSPLSLSDAYSASSALIARVWIQIEFILVTDRIDLLKKKKEELIH